MKINGSNGSNINFIEQRSVSIDQLNKTKESTTSTINDSYEQKTKSVSYASITEANESFGVLETANSAINKLQEENKNLQDIVVKSIHFPESKSDFEEQFEATTGRMLDIVDNTHFGQTQLFYTPIRLSAGSEELSFSLGADFGIEDFSLDNEEDLKVLEQKLLDIKQSIQENSKYIEVASFNSLASMDMNKSNQIENISQKSFHKELMEQPSKQEISRAHDVSSLKDKVSLLLGE